MGENEQQGETTHEVDTEENTQEPEDNAELSEDEELDKILAGEDTEEEADEEEGADEEEEEEEVEGSILDDVELDEDEEDLGLPEGFDEMSPEEQDQEIFLALEDDSTWDEWRKSAEEVHGEVDRTFAVDMLKAGYEPTYLSEKGIYSLGDFKEFISHLEGKLDPKAIVLADPENEEMVAEFLEEHIGIPQKIEGYDKNVLKGTIYENDEKLSQALLERAHAASWTNGQLAEAAAYGTAVEKELAAREKRELNFFNKEQKAKLNEVYGENSKLITKDVLTALKTTPAGKEFLEKYGDSKAVKSADFIGALYNILNYKMSDRNLKDLINTRVPDNNSQIEAKFSTLSVDKLLQKRDKLVSMELAHADIDSLSPEKRVKLKQLWDTVEVLNKLISTRT